MPLALMRLVVTLLAACVFAQPALAGQFLAGDADMIGVHGAVAALIELLALLQIGTALFLWRPGRGRLWPVVASVGVFLAVFAQAALGYTRVLAAHVPLGATLFAVMALLLVWVWRPRHGGGTDEREERSATP